MSDVTKTQPKPAPDFELADSEGRKVRLSDFRGKKHVVLVFNRGFA
jgi:peroxiredoxin